MEETWELAALDMSNIVRYLAVAAIFLVSCSEFEKSTNGETGTRAETETRVVEIKKDQKKVSGLLVENNHSKFSENIWLDIHEESAVLKFLFDPVMDSHYQQIYDLITLSCDAKGYHMRQRSGELKYPIKSEGEFDFTNSVGIRSRNGKFRPIAMVTIDDEKIDLVYQKHVDNEWVEYDEKIYRQSNITPLLKSRVIALSVESFWLPKLKSGKNIRSEYGGSEVLNFNLKTLEPYWKDFEHRCADLTPKEIFDDQN